MASWSPTMAFPFVLRVVPYYPWGYRYRHNRDSGWRHSRASTILPPYTTGGMVAFDPHTRRGIKLGGKHTPWGISLLPEEPPTGRPETIGKGTLMILEQYYIECL